MEFAAAHHFSKSTGAVIDIISSPTFAASIEGPAGVRADASEVERLSDGSLRIATRWTVAVQALPAAARSFAPSGFAFTQRSAWSATGREDSRACNLTFDTGSLPVSISGQGLLSGHDDTSMMRYTVSLSAAVPFFGRQIEQVARKVVEQAIEAEAAAIVAAP